ncbi:MAG TPA: virulence RhuM family protein [Blastocatellia bacterium]|nr:virulence RhuM family protein [Blastocatellia bacterium]
MENEPLGHSEIILYQTEDKRTRIEVRLEDETVWLSQSQMAELFQTTKQNISLHVRNIFAEHELQEDQVVKEYLTTAADGKKYATGHYNLDVIISVGYRVKSHRGTQFRIWATQRLREYLIKGFALDDERLKEGGTKNTYFDELLARIRDIRASEKNFYRKVLDIYATSIDYDLHSDVSYDFFAIVQNKMHWAAHGHTAAELIAERADADKPNMGLTSWKDPKVRKSDVTVAKNYLNADEIEILNLIVSQYLDFAELQARMKKAMYMRDWVRKLDDFLRVNEREILKDAGKISHQLAQQLAEAEYDKFEKKRLAAESEAPNKDFEEAVKTLTSRKRKR